MPDVEKLLAKIFTYSIKHKQNAVYFEDVNLIKMKEFRLLLSTFKAAEDVLAPLMGSKDGLASTRLQNLLSFDDVEGGMLPSDMGQQLKEFERMIIWKTVARQPKDSWIPEP